MHVVLLTRHAVIVGADAGAQAKCDVGQSLTTVETRPFGSGRAFAGVRCNDRLANFRLLTLRYSYRGHRYVDRRVAHYYRGVATARGIWSYAICGIRCGPKC